VWFEIVDESCIVYPVKVCLYWEKLERLALKLVSGMALSDRDGRIWILRCVNSSHGRVPPQTEECKAGLRSSLSLGYEKSSERDAGKVDTFNRFELANWGPMH
jgi:hypothetical protein